MTMLRVKGAAAQRPLKFVRRAKTKTWNDLTGKWDVKNGKLTLLYFDRPKQTFTIKKGSGNVLTLAKSGGFLLKKVDPSKCQ